MESSISNNNIKYIKSCTCKCNCSSGNNDRSMDTLFRLVWRNTVIRNEILFHTRLFNIHYNKDITFTRDQLSNYKYRNYLDKIIFYNGDDKSIYTGLVPTKKIKKSTKPKKKKVINKNLQQVPYGVSHISFYTERILQEKCIPNSVTSINFSCYISQIFTKDVLPDSITSLTFNSSINPDQPISKTWLPKSLKSLSLGQNFYTCIDLNELPESLTELNIHKDFYGKIIPRSIPSSSIIKSSCNFKFNSSNGNILTSKSIPKSTTYLEFEEFNDEPINEGDIPRNVTSIKFNGYNGGLKPGSLPKSLKSLDLGISPVDEIVANVLPSNLTNVNLGAYGHTLSPNLFPLSITSIKFHILVKSIPVGYFNSFPNLKSLEILNHLEVIPAETLPPSLTSLDLGPKYTKKLDVNALPTSLTNLCIGKLKIKQPGKLPSSITSLKISPTQILEGELPCNLQELYITSQSFNQPLSFDSFEQGILPRSLKSIYIDIRNINYISSLDPHFFNKYIKLLTFNYK